MLPFLLHLSMHDQERIVREMDGNLSLFVGGRSVNLWYNLAYSELSRHSKRQASDDGSRSKVCEMVGVPAYAFLPAVVAVDKGCVGLPFVWRLELEFLAAWLEVLHATLYLFVNSLADLGRNVQHFSRCLPNFADVASIVHILSLVRGDLIPAVNIQTGGVWRFYSAIEHLELVSAEACYFLQELTHHSIGFFGREKVVD